MDQVIITYAVLGYDGTLIRRYFDGEDAAGHMDRLSRKHPVAIRREWWRIDEDESNVMRTQAFDTITSGSNLDWPPKETKS